MNRFKSWLIVLGLTISCVVSVPAQTTSDDGTTLKQIIIFGRHSIRSSTVEPSTLAKFSGNPYPGFTGVPTGYLTPNGREAARLLGAYFRDYLRAEGLLTGNLTTDLPHLHFRANSIQRSNITASSFGTGLTAGATVPVHSYELGVPDPIFDPIATKVAAIDPVRAATEVQGLYGTGAALSSAYSGERSLIATVLAPSGTIDPTLQPFTLTASQPVLGTGGVIDTGGLSAMNGASDPFVMQYADGFPSGDVAWGRLSPDTLSQETRLAVLQINIEMRSPYINQVQSSNAASHVLRSMIQAATGEKLSGALGNAKSRILVVTSSDYYVSGLAGLLGLHWTLPGYQPDFCAPGGALVFELRRSKASKTYLVRAFYTAQSFDQLRNLTPLTLDNPPATMQLLVPGGSKSATDLDVRFSTFKTLVRKAIGRKYVQDPGKESPPGVLTDVPLQ
jgi:4-phytase / acid phosphatase